MRNPVVVFGIAFLVFLAGTPAFSTLNPDPDEIGIYFDTSADAVCITAVPSVPFSAYLIITNPSSDEVWAIEFSMCTEIVGGDESLLFRLSETWSAGFVDLGVVYDWCLDGRVIGFYEPVPWVGENVVLVQLQYMLLANMDVEFYLGPYPVETIEDGLPAYADANNVVVPLRISSGGPGLPVAAVNGQCNVVSVESKSFSGLKCLYR